MLGDTDEVLVWVGLFWFFTEFVGNSVNKPFTLL
jgi:hypothetical protein